VIFHHTARWRSIADLIDNPLGEVYLHENRVVFISQARPSNVSDDYDSKTASQIVGVSLRQLQYWDEQDFIRPSVRLAEGRGTRRLYSFHDLVCLKVVKDLARYGFSLQKIRRCLKPLKDNADHTKHPNHALKYLTNGEDLFIITDDRQKMLDAMERKFVLSLGIGRLVHELDDRARRAVLAVTRKPAKKPRRSEERRARSA
jgi:DNA-binding transcriptional MerR regulator